MLKESTKEFIDRKLNEALTGVNSAWVSYTGREEHAPRLADELEEVGVRIRIIRDGIRKWHKKGDGNA
jgi:hypothetical protein